MRSALYHSIQQTYSNYYYLRITISRWITVAVVMHFSSGFHSSARHIVDVFFFSVCSFESISEGKYAQTINQNKHQKHTQTNIAHFGFYQTYVSHSHHRAWNLYGISNVFVHFTFHHLNVLEYVYDLLFLYLNNEQYATNMWIK